MAAHKNIQVFYARAAQVLEYWCMISCVWGRRDGAHWVHPTGTLCGVWETERRTEMAALYRHMQEMFAPCNLLSSLAVHFNLPTRGTYIVVINKQFELQSVQK